MTTKANKLLNISFIFLLALIVTQCKTDKKMDNQVEQPVNNLKNIAALEYEIKAQLGEGAIWNHLTQEFCWIDIEGKKVHFYSPSTKTNRSFDTPTRIGTIVPIDEENAIVGLHDGAYILNTKTGEYTLFSGVETDIPDNRLNDGKCDPSGRFWVGTMELTTKPHAAGLYMVDGKGEVTQQLDSISISNGIVWTADKKTMYYIDTPTQEVRGYDYDDATGNISNERIAVKLADSLGGPDGMAIDEEGMLWVCMWNGASVLRLNPNTGDIIDKIEVPALNVTSCAFGGKNLDTLYITTVSLYMNEENQKKYPLAGSIFKAVPGVKGVKSDFFKAE